MTDKEALELALEHYKNTRSSFEKFSEFSFIIFALFLVLASFLARSQDGDAYTFLANMMIGAGFFLILFLKEFKKARGALSLLAKLDKDQFDK